MRSREYSLGGIRFILEITQLNFVGSALYVMQEDSVEIDFSYAHVVRSLTWSLNCGVQTKVTVTFAITEDEAQQRRRSRKEEANRSPDASNAEADNTLSAIGRAFALQASRNQIRSLKVRVPNTHEVHQFL